MAVDGTQQRMRHRPGAKIFVTGLDEPDGLLAGGEKALHRVRQRREASRVAQTIVVCRLRTVLELGRPLKTMACPTANLLYSYSLDTAPAHFRRDHRSYAVRAPSQDRGFPPL